MLELVLVSVFWSFAFGMIKSYLSASDPFQLAFLRNLIALLCFLPWLRANALSRSQILIRIAIGAVQYGLMYMFYLHAYQTLQAHQIAMLTAFSPLYIAVLTAFFERNHTWWLWLVSGLALIGGLVLIYQPGTLAWQGALYMQASSFCFAAGQIAYRYFVGPQPFRQSLAQYAWFFLGASMLTALGAWSTDLTQVLTWPWQTWLAIFYLGAISTGLCFFLWNRGAAKVASGQLAVVQNIDIPLAVLVSVMIFDESAAWLQLLGGSTLIVLASYLAQRKAST